MWAVKIKLRWEDGAEYEYDIQLETSEKLNEYHFTLPGFTDEAQAQINRSTRSVTVTTTYTEKPLPDFHKHLKLAVALGTDFVGLLDVNACCAKTKEWVLDTAKTETAPCPKSLYTIHSIFEESTGEVWLHTHGLSRCGSIEWEIMDLNTESAGIISELICTIASYAISETFPDADEAFEIMQGIPIVWLPHEEAIKKFSAKAMGGAGDRDMYHSEPSGVLLLKTKKFFFFKSYESLGPLAEFMAYNPLMWFSSEETERMTSMAKEKFETFAEYFKKFQGNEDFMFTAKIGYQVDGAEEDHEKEHLWFEVSSIEGEEVQAKLLNQPYYIERMKEGDVGMHSLKNLTDWQIMSAFGNCVPSQISNFQIELEKAGV